MKLDNVRQIGEDIDRSVSRERAAVDAAIQHVRAFHELSAEEAAKGGDCSSQLPDELDERYSTAARALATARRATYMAAYTATIEPGLQRRWSRVADLYAAAAAEADELREIQVTVQRIAAANHAVAPALFVREDELSLRVLEGWSARNRQTVRPAAPPARRPLSLGAILQRVLTGA
jgi:hypothetical protein